MNQCRLGYVGLLAFFLQGHPVSAQSSLDVLEQDLNQFTQQHQEASSQAFASQIAQLDAASKSPDAAINLYQIAGGVMPDPTPVSTLHDHESPSEKADRLAQDQANLSSLAYVVQLHCGLMRYAIVFLVKPDTQNLQQDWIAWLKTAAQIYPQAVASTAIAPPPPPPPKPQRTDGTRKSASGTGTASIPRPAGWTDTFRSVSLRDSIIGKYLAFQGWRDKEQGQWSVKELPRLYRSNVLDPLRATPTADTLAAWDTYIAMKGAEARDPDRWSQVDYPALQFERACDDFAIAPSTDKLNTLISFIKANADHPQIDDMLGRVRKIMEGYRAQKSGAATTADATAPSVSSTPGGPSVTVTTTTEGDATIITTHTNSAPNPAPPNP